MAVDTTQAPARERVARALAQRPEGTTAATLVEATGASRPSVSKALTALERDGHARRHRHEPEESERPLPDTWYPTAPASPPDDTAEERPQSAAEPRPCADDDAEPGEEAAAPPAASASDAEPEGAEPQPAVRRTRDGRPVARPGQLRALVAQHLIDYPDSEFTPGEIAKVLSRSAGAVANALEKLTATGEAHRTCDAPRRYQTRPQGE
ncbi:MarR family transcriptional regulator [Streptomonospora salina]|uniref:Putative transcriptional regulator n=1 Tax=Streptomonospora salina TaxID=104205 RepID=A0A841EFL6_9ACTN|nr:helix-turn-helix domain-containing protein [Streptomonospora salina]MBB6000119.1 putative transcriptional regulator [Streptomonospora salina]